MNITLSNSETLELILATYWHIKSRYSQRHCFRRPCLSIPAAPLRVAEQYRELRELIAISRRLELARERDFDRLFHRPRCRDMAELRRRNAEYRTRQRIRRDAANLKFTPLQKAA